MTTNFKWPVKVRYRIAAPASEVWGVISAPGHLESCHPFCASNPVFAWPGRRSRDEVRYFSGWVYERHFKDWMEGTGYDLEIGKAGGDRSFVTWRIAPRGASSCILSISVCSSVLLRYPAYIRCFPYLFRVRPMLRKYLQAVVQGVEWNVTRGEAVAPDQFGRHPWFSSPLSTTGE